MNGGGGGVSRVVWSSQYRDVDTNAIFMFRSEFNSYYGIENDQDRFDFAREVGTTVYENGALTSAVGVNGVGDGNGNIIPGTEEYIVYDQQGAVILDPNGNVKKWDEGANLIYVDLGNGNLALFHDRLARNGSMTPEAFSNGLLSIVNGMALPVKTNKVKNPLYNGRFEASMLHGGHIRVSLPGGVKAYTTVDWNFTAGQAYTNWVGVPGDKIMITYQSINGRSLTVDSLRSILGYHEYYGHGMEHLAHHISAAEEARLAEITNSYFKR